MRGLSWPGSAYWASWHEARGRTAANGRSLGDTGMAEREAAAQPMPRSSSRASTQSRGRDPVQMRTREGADWGGQGRGGRHGHDELVAMTDDGW